MRKHLVGFVIAVLVVITPTRAMPQSWRAVDRAIGAALDTTVDSIPPRRYAALWQAFDRAVLASLRSRASIDSINTILSRRKAFAGPSAGQQTASVGGATFWRELPRDAPSYYVAGIGADRPDPAWSSSPKTELPLPSARSCCARHHVVWDADCAERRG